MAEDWFLLVEDNEDEIDLFRSAYARLGIDLALRVAKDGEQALRLLGLVDDADAPPTLPRLVILDLKLPKVDGLEVLSRLNRSPPHSVIPVVVLTSSIEPDDLVSAYLNGANSYLRKPVDFVSFRKLIALTMEYWLNHNQAVAH